MVESNEKVFPVVSVETMRASDAYTIENFIADEELMDRAGLGIARLCDFPGPYAIVCGPGNNGGDGYVAARYLAEREGEDAVTVFFTKEPTSCSSRFHRDMLKGTDVRVEPFSSDCDLATFGTVIDCLLGTGFSGVPRGSVAEAIDAINGARKSGARVVSADINSGVNGDTGEGELAVKSDLTVSIGFLKEGMIQPAISEWTCRIANVDIGIQLVGEPSALLDKSQLPSWVDGVNHTVSAMTQQERREYLIRYFMGEQQDEAISCSATMFTSEGEPLFADEIDCIPADAGEQRYLLRGLLNTRRPGLPPQEVLEVQDAYLRRRIAEAGIVCLEDIPQMGPHLRLWRGDITTLACDAIVNAANSGMTGCWLANHICIDNCIHTFAGVQLRDECARIMQVQGDAEPTGRAKITGAYNLPCKHVIHTVGPIANGDPDENDDRLLASSYASCYRLARENGLRNIAFCCISTGVFGFPQKRAADIATSTVAALQAVDEEDGVQPLDVCFVVFGDTDERLYRELLA